MFKSSREAVQTNAIAVSENPLAEQGKFRLLCYRDPQDFFDKSNLTETSQHPRCFCGILREAQNRIASRAIRAKTMPLKS